MAVAGPVAAVGRQSGVADIRGLREGPCQKLLDNLLSPTTFLSSLRSSLARTLSLSSLLSHPSSLFTPNPSTPRVPGAPPS
eukprot:674574-Rhodomonas_salina.1